MSQSDRMTQALNYRGTNFTDEERQNNQLNGLLPTNVESVTDQHKRTYQQFQTCTTPYRKHQFLNILYNTNRRLFFSLIEAHLEEMFPIIYTPTIAESVMNFSRDYVWGHDALYLDTDRPEEIEARLLQASQSLQNIDIMVITDGEGVLGIGDWGLNGVMIAVGKSSVYTVASGFSPKRILSVIIDNGTNNEQLLNDEFYLGKKQKRKPQADYLAFIDRFVKITRQFYPRVLFHWEDFSKDNARVILDRYKNEIPSFNDDIQGTGIMMVAAVNAALSFKEESFADQRIVIFGAGTAGLGIADQLKNEMICSGLCESEAAERIFMVDRQGLLIRGDETLSSEQACYAKELKAMPTLEEVVGEVKPAILIGSSGQAGAFTEQIVKTMCSYQENPSIFPISNPTDLAEAKAEDIIKWSQGKALVVTGSPSESVVYGGLTHEIGQANNAFLYPGLGFGSVAAQAARVTPQMLLAAAHAIRPEHEQLVNSRRLIPHLEELRRCSYEVASAVFQAAIEDGVSSFELKDMENELAKYTW